MQQSAQSMTLFQRVTKLAGTALKSFGALAANMALSFGISFAISKAVEGITWVYKQISGKAAEEAKQKIKELGEEAQSSIDSITSSLEENTKTINDVKQKYAELAQGINNLGKASQSQGTLSNDEYSEFLDISNQLAELFPQLTVGYDDNGNAILNLSGNVGTITGQLNDLIEAEKELAAQKIRNDIGATWDAFGENIEESENKISSLEETIKTYNNALSEFQKISSGGQVYMNSSSIDQYAEAFKAVGIIKSDANFFDKKDNKYLLEARNYDSLMGIDFSKLSKTQKDKIEGYLKQTVQSYNTQLEAAQNELVNRNKEFSTNVIASVMDSDAYQNTDNKSIIDTILTNYDYTQLYKDFDGNWENAYNYLYNQIIGAFDGQNGKEIQNIWNNLLSIDTDAALAENIPKIEAYIKQLAELLNIDWTKLAPALGYDLEADKQKIKTAKERLGFNYSTDARDRQNASIQEKNRKINELTQGLTDEEWEILADVDIPDDVLDYSAEKFREWIAEQNKNAVIETKIRTSTDAVNSFEDTKKALSSLDDLYSQTVLKNASGDGIANGFASPDTINAVESAFGGIAEEDAKVASALQEFEETLVKFPNDADKAQQAINELVTAYIDQTDILQDLTEEKKEWAKAQLKAMGITNAEEVVESRLNQQIKKNIEAFGKYKESVADYSKKLSTLGNTDEGYSDALEGMRAGFEELFNSMNQFKDENGEVITVPISTEFAQNNLEDLMAAANGSTEALDRLQAAATADYIVQCGINVPSGAKEGLRTQMNSLISQIQSEIEDVEIGAQLDNTQAISSLVQLAKQAGLSSEEVKNALSSIGVEPQISYKDMEVPDLEENIKEYNGHPVFGGYKVKEYKKVKLPIVKYGKTSSGTGTGAIYGGGSSNNSSGGGNGGGGQQQDSEEMFDWIEVGIKRCEEELARFDRKAGNIYDNWANRNKAVKDSIASITKEIKYQTKAAEAYKKSANDVNLADMYLSKTKSFVFDADNAKNSSIKKSIQSAKTKNDINPSVYTKDGKQDKNLKKQVEEYWDLWNKYSKANKNKTKIPEEYIKKIQQGALKIETIKDETLRDALKKYQELWDKGIAAEDAAAQLRIDKLAKYEQLFKNTQSNYESLISLTDTGVKMADAKLQNLETRGYFAQDSYYYNKKALKETERKYLTQERDKLIKQLKQAEENGIDKTSEAYINMQIAIENVKTEIQETTNDIQKLNKAIRELKWEKFDYTQETIDKLHDENDFLVEVMNQKKLVDEKGNFTAQGTATIGLHAVDYDVYMKQAQDYKNELYGIGGIYDQLKNDENNKTLIARRDELLQKQRESIKAAYQERDAIKSLVEQGINNHLSSLQKLIDEYKNAQSEAKNLYDYQKNISKITKNIQDYEKILSAYQNDNSEESRKIIQETTVKLEEERENLKQTEWDHYIQETEKFLDNMYSEYEEILTSYLDDIDKLMQDMIDATNNNSKAINKTIHDECYSIGYSRSKEMQELFGNNGLSTNNLVTGFTNGIENGASQVVIAINGLKETVKTMMDYDPNKKGTNSNSSSGSQNSGSTTSSSKSSNKTDSTATGKKSDAKNWIETYGAQTVTLKKGTVIYENQTSNKSKTTLSKDDTAILTKIVDKERGYKVEYTDSKKKKHVGWITPSSIKEYTWSALDSLKGYKTGGRNIKDEYAWTQENGAEIIRTKDGAVLTPVKGSTVFTNNMTQELWNFAKDPYKYIGNVALNPTITNKTNGNNTISNNNKIEIILPNVKDYNSLKSELQKDKKFTSFIQSVTIGEMMNQSTLSKNKY